MRENGRFGIICWIAAVGRSDPSIGSGRAITGTFVAIADPERNDGHRVAERDLDVLQRAGELSGRIRPSRRVLRQACSHEFVERSGGIAAGERCGIVVENAFDHPADLRRGER